MSSLCTSERLHENWGSTDGPSDVRTRTLLPRSSAEDITSTPHDPNIPDSDGFHGARPDLGQNLLAVARVAQARAVEIHNGVFDP